MNPDYISPNDFFKKNILETPTDFLEGEENTGEKPFQFYDAHTGVLTLLEIKQLLQDGVSICTHAIEPQTQQTLSSESPVIPADTAYALSKISSHLDSLIAAYGASCDYNPNAIWQYIAKQKHYLDNDDGLVKLKYENEVLYIFMASFPTTNRGNDAIINKILAAQLLKIPEFPVWSKWQASFLHVYPTNGKCVVRDCDNYDYKKTIDLIAFAVGSSDNAMHFSMETDSCFNDKYPSGTYIKVSQKNSDSPDFSGWDFL